MQTAGFTGALKKPNKLLIAEFAIVFTVAAAIIYALILPSASYHFQKVVLNYYPSGKVDFSADTTELVRGLSLMALMTMVVGLAVGAAISVTSLSQSRTALAVGKTTVAESMELLFRSGFLRHVVTEEGRKFEITDTGLRFIDEYQSLKRTLEQQPTQKIADT